MKYFGEHSLSSTMAGILRVTWHVVLVLAVAAGIFGTIVVLTPIFGDPIGALIAANCAPGSKDLADWKEFVALPVFVRALMLPYLAVLTVLLLTIIRRARGLFESFRNNVLFSTETVDTTRSVGKLMIVYGIMTFSFSVLLLSVLLLFVCEILKNGKSLKEEVDLTI